MKFFETQVYVCVCLLLMNLMQKAGNLHLYNLSTNQYFLFTITRWSPSTRLLCLVGFVFYFVFETENGTQVAMSHMLRI